jgi:uncharacterized membrane protein YqjE
MLQDAGGAMFIQALLHGQLAAIEWEEERRRLLKMLAIGLIGFACLLCAVLFMGGLAISVTWDTGYRAHALAALVLLFTFGTAVAWWRLEKRSAAGGQAFAASREELAADAAMLKATR